MSRPHFNNHYLYPRLLRAALHFLFLILPVFLVVTSAFAANIEAVLDSTDGSSSFVVQDSAAAPTAGIDSTGNMTLKGCLRLNGTLTKCTSPQSLVVDGNIGIGTAVPRAGLDVAGDVHAGGVYYAGTVAGTRLGTDNALRPSMASGYLNILGGAGNARISLGDADIHFGAGDGTEKMTLTAAGNVGIGSSAPGGKFEVSGGAARIVNG